MWFIVFSVKQKLPQTPPPGNNLARKTQTSKLLRELLEEGKHELGCGLQVLATVVQLWTKKMKSQDKSLELNEKPSLQQNNDPKIIKKKIYNEVIVDNYSRIDKCIVHMYGLQRREHRCYVRGRGRAKAQKADFMMHIEKFYPPQKTSRT